MVTLLVVLWLCEAEVWATAEAAAAAMKGKAE